MAEYSSTELMAVVAARTLEDGKSVFVGTGLPMIAAVFAQRTHAPRLLIVFEAGGIGPRVPVLPVSVAESKTFYQGVAASSHARGDVALPGRLPGLRVPGGGGHRPLRQHQHHRHRRLRPPQGPPARIGRGQRRGLVLLADHRDHAPGAPPLRREGRLPHHPRLPHRAGGPGGRRPPRRHRPLPGHHPAGGLRVRGGDQAHAVARPPPRGDGGAGAGRERVRDPARRPRSR